MRYGAERIGGVEEQFVEHCPGIKALRLSVEQGYDLQARVRQQRGRDEDDGLLVEASSLDMDELRVTLSPTTPSLADELTNCRAASVGLSIHPTSLMLSMSRFVRRPHVTPP